MIMRWRLDQLAIGETRWFPPEKKTGAYNAISYYRRRQPWKDFCIQRDAADGEYRVLRIL